MQTGKTKIPLICALRVDTISVIIFRVGSKSMTNCLCTIMFQELDCMFAIMAGTFDNTTTVHLKRISRFREKPFECTTGIIADRLIVENCFLTAIFVISIPTSTINASFTVNIVYESNLFFKKHFIIEIVHRCSP